jgi:hypothetical protein
MIVAMAKEAGVEITPEQLAQLDGGDLVAAVRAAKKGERDAFETRIAAAEARAALIPPRPRRDVLDMSDIIEKPTRPPPAQAATPQATPARLKAQPLAVMEDAQTAEIKRLQGLQTRELQALAEATVRQVAAYRQHPPGSAYERHVSEDYRRGLALLQHVLKERGVDQKSSPIKTSGKSGGKEM